MSTAKSIIAPSTKAKSATFTHLGLRHIAACLMALLTATITIPGMTTYLTASAADQIIVPILLFPLIWLGLFMYSYLAKQAYRPWLLMLLLILSHAWLSYSAIWGQR